MGVLPDSVFCIGARKTSKVLDERSRHFDRCSDLVFVGCASFVPTVSKALTVRADDESFGWLEGMEEAKPSKLL